MSVLLTDKLQPRTTGIAITVVGDMDVTGNISVAGTVTYEDVTNVDSLGIITARTGLRVTAGGVVINAGVSTFANTLNITGGEVKVGAAFSVSQAGVVTATSYYGDGSNLSNITSTTINNNADNRLITGSGTANTLEGESNLTFDGNNLAMSGTGVFTITRNSRTLTLEGNYGNEGHPAIKTSSGHNLRIFTSGNNERLRITSGGDVEIDGTAAGVSSVTWDASANSLIFKDGSRAKFGDGSDLHVYHNGTNSVIREEGTGNLNIQTTGGNVDILVNTTETAAKFISDGAVELYHNNVKTFSTESWGNTSYGQILKVLAGEGVDATLQLVCDDGDDNADLWQIFADASHGGLNIQNYASGSYETNLAAYGNGSIDLYYDGTKKFETSGGGTITTGIATASSFVPTEGQLSNRNLIINGGMNINQYGSSSSTSVARQIFDRWYPSWNNGTITQSKETLTSGGAYDAGHRSCLRLTNTSAAGSGAGTYVEVYYKFEAQDIAKCGWNYKSASSYITLSFWLRSSVAQTYSCTLQTRDGTKYFHPFTAVISSTNTWTKITKTFAGNSNLQIDDDNDNGLMLWVDAMQGSNFHNSSWNTDGWFAASGNYMFAGTTDTTWGTTAGATWDITGFQLEVGSAATPFEHRSYSDELRRCQRYFTPISAPVGFINATEDIGIGWATANTEVQMRVNCPVQMRSTPTLTQTTSTNYWRIGGGNYGGDKYISNQWNVNNLSPTGGNLYVAPDSGLSSYIGEVATIQSKSTSARMGLTAEL